MRGSIELRTPSPRDGTRLWHLAQLAGGLDVNTPYAYLLWCRDFAATSVVAIDPDGDVPVGFVTGYRRPDAPDTLFLWQVGVLPDRRGQGIAGRMVDELLARTVPLGVRHLEATVGPSNVASASLFAGVAERAGAPLAHPAPGGFPASAFPGDHEAEDLVRIGPLGPVVTPTADVPRTAAGADGSTDPAVAARA